jgi:teichuronic acid exporter
LSETAVSFAPIITEPEPEPDVPTERPLGGTVLRGLLWLSGVRWIAQLFMWASTLFIARLLSPADYGLVAMATILIGFLEIFTDSLGAAVVQAKDLTKRTAEEMHGATCLFGLFAAGLVVLGAPLWARIQGEPQVIPILQVFALATILTSVGAVPYSMLNKRLAFGRVAQGQFVRGLVTAGATLGGAFLFKSYWALVLGSLAGRFCFTAMLVWAEPTKPRLPRKDSGIGKLMRFSGMMTGDRFFYQLRSNIDLMIIGAKLGSQSLGLYVMATALALLPLDKLGSAFAPVAYPAFARLQDNKSELRRYFLGLTLGTMAIAIPTCVGLIVTAPLLVPTILGNQWVAAVRPLQIAAIVTPIIFHLGILSPLLNALGRVDLSLRITMWTSILTVPAIFVGVNFGIVGVAIASATVVACVGIYGEMLAFRLIGLRVSELASTIVPVMTASLGMALCVLGISFVLPSHWPALVRLMIEVGTGIASFIGWALVLHHGVVVQQLRVVRAAWSNR